MRTYLLLGLLLLSPSAGQEPSELERDRQRTLAHAPRSLLITVKAQFSDGTPARGEIACDGYWCKYDEDPYCDWDLPYLTDSRGACIFNPPIEWRDDALTCRVYSGTRFGLLTFTVVDGGHYTIHVPGPSPE